MINNEIEFIMGKTHATHARINVAVEFVCDLHSEMQFANDGQSSPPPEKR